jgi:hypothetical protein
MENLENLCHEIMEFKRAGCHEDKGNILEREPRESKDWY